MRSNFDRQLRQLNDEMLRMGTMIEENIQQAIRALVNGDVALAREIMERDEDIDKKQREIESICFQLLVRQQPVVAKDLRIITAAMKMVTDMERIGDHAADISEITILLSREEQPMACQTIVEMAAEASVMLIHSVDAFAERNTELARQVIEHDDIVDGLFDRVKQELITLIRNNPTRGEQELDLLMIAKYLERIADHATNIAELV